MLGLNIRFPNRADRREAKSFKVEVDIISLRYSQHEKLTESLTQRYNRLARPPTYWDICLI